jgi:mRNA-degrading endonuclease RelE of RelBE toxin-antitoxin system
LNYRVTFTVSAQKAFNKLDQTVKKRILPVILALGGNPRPHGYIQLKAKQGYYRVMAEEYRVVYMIEDKNREVVITAIGHRS